jgi:predicted MFS family arabinose efflux permease
LLAVLLLKAGPGEVGLLASVQSLPFLLLAIPLGLLADRSSRRMLMAVSEILRALALLLLVAALLVDQLSIGLLAGVGFLAAVGTVAFSVAAPSLVPALVPPDALTRANGRLELARSLAFAGGPALAGALIGWTGATSAFVLSAMMSVAAVFFLWRIAEPVRAVTARRHPLLELREGAALVWRHRLLRPIALTSVFWNLGWFMLQASYVPYAIRVLGLSASGVGLSLALYGVGMVMGALAAPRIVGWLSAGQAIVLGPAFSLVAALVMAATLLVPQGLLAAFSFWLFGFGPIIWVITSTTLRQTVTPLRMLGRVGSINMVVSSGARPLGAALGGLTGSQWGEVAALSAVVACFLVQLLIILDSPVRTLQRLPESVGN